jgi:membrane protease YdiL (CAAX protease family)
LNSELENSELESTPLNLRNRLMAMTSENPFLSIRARGLIPWMIFGGFLIGVPLSFLSFIPALDALEVYLFGFCFYFLLFRWVKWKAADGGIELGKFFRKTGQARAGRIIGLVVAIFAFEIASILFYQFCLAHLVPGILALAIGKDHPTVAPAVRDLRLLLQILVAVVLAPVVEELLFRGILLNRWAAKWGIRTGILVSAAAFAIPHLGDPGGAFVFGLVMGLLYCKTRALWAPIAVHVINNCIGMAPRLAGWRESAIPTGIEEHKSFPVLGAILLVASVPFLAAFIYRNWPGRDDPSPYQRELLADALHQDVDGFGPHEPGFEPLSPGQVSGTTSPEV